VSIDITEAAAKHILEHLHKNALSQPVRLMLKTKGGCGDLSPAFYAGAGIIPDEDEVLDKHGLSLVCNLARLPELDGVTVDLRVDTKDMSKVLVLKSATLDSCGCGQAVTPKKT
jgi:Fe-S cluster assembly iron-binding protein IscA